MCRCCEIIKYWLCCYTEEDDDYDIDTICNIDWSAYQFDDTLYGTVEEPNKENNDTN